MGRPATLLLALGLALGTAWVAFPDRTRGPDRRAAVIHHDAGSAGDLAAPPRLRGRPPVRRPPIEAERVEGLRPVAGSGDGPAARGPEPGPIQAAIWKRDAPRSPEDPEAGRGTLGLTPTAFCVARSDLVGRVHPHGLRGAVTDPRYDWLGVARITRDPETGVEDDGREEVEDPLVTAVRGRVVAIDGAAIPGAEVILYSAFYVRQAYYDHRVREIGRTFSDAEGAFDLRPIALDTVHFGEDGEVLLTIRHPHHADLIARRLPNLRPETENDLGSFALPDRPVVVHGWIRDLGSKPVAGAYVRVSGSVNPVDYDKTERMVVLKDCPTAMTDAEGRYRLTGFAAGVHEISVHVNIDCVIHAPSHWEGEREWSPRVRHGGSVRGLVVGGEGVPLAGAVVSGGGNWTPTNADGTFWLDNISAGPFTLEVAHHAWRTTHVPDVRSGMEEVEVVLDRPLRRVTLEVVDPLGAPVSLVAVDWTWSGGRGPGLFVPDSRYWHDADGLFRLIVPEGAAGARISVDQGRAETLGSSTLTEGAEIHIVLPAPDPASAPEPERRAQLPARRSK